MVDDGRRWREVVKAMDRAQEGAVTGVADGGDPAGEITTSREAAGESGAAAASTTAAVVAETREGMGRVSGVVGGGWSIGKIGCGAATGVADGGGPAGEATISREAAGERGAAAPSTAAAGVAEMR